MKNILIATIVLALSLFAFNVNAAEVDLYGSVNHKVSYDDDTSGKAILKAQNNGSIVGVDFSQILFATVNSEGVETGGIKGFGKIEVGIDIDESVSDILNSRLAYVGVDLGPLGAVSGGRQSNPHAGVSKTNIFNIYGGNATFKYADRSSSSLKYANSVGSISFNAMAVIDGSTGKDGLDAYDLSASLDFGPVALAGGLVDDKVNNVTYTVASASISLVGIDLAGTYSYKDTTTTDLTGLEYTASKSFGDTTFAVGYQDKEGTASYITYGASHSLTDDLLGFAEFQTTDNDTGTDTTQMAVGIKFSF